jgi:hypothetical protein
MGGRARVVIAVVSLASVLSGAVTAARAQATCVRLDSSWWLVGAARVFQSSGDEPRSVGMSLERHFVDRRILHKTATGFRLDIQRVKLGLRDTSVAITVEYGENGGVTKRSGDAESLAQDVSSLLVLPCAAIRSGYTLADLGERTDTSVSVIQRSVTHVIATQPLTFAAPIDTLGMALAVVLAQRAVTDTSRGQLLRQMPNQLRDTVKPWSVLTGTEVERKLVRVSDGAVMFRERTKKLTGRGWVPPHAVGDTVAIRVEHASIERVVHSVAAAGIISFSRRGEYFVSGSARDTIGVHYREWRGDTLVVRQVRRSGWRDELRTVWRDSALVSATLIEPGTATQPLGPFRRTMVVDGGYLRDSGAKDTANATPTHAWAIALDGFEDALVPALLAIPADSQPHRFSMYGVQADRGAWLNWSVNIVARGAIRIARFSSLQRQWVGSFIFTPAGELILSVLGGAQGVTRLPGAGTRLAALLEGQQGKFTRDDLVPKPPVPAAPTPR